MKKIKTHESNYLFLSLLYKPQVPFQKVWNFNLNEKNKNP
jgi:hypothetical protein